MDGPCGTGWVIGAGLTLAAGSAFGQAQPNGGVQSPAKGQARHCDEGHSRSRRGERPHWRLRGAPHTLAEALTATYYTQPQLLAERAKLRATDESVPQALSGWRPTVIIGGTTGYGDGVSRQFEGGGFLKSQTGRLVGTAQATLTQPLYNGGKTPATINRAKNQVMAERATLIQQEQTSFINVVTAYVGVIQAQQVLALNVNNEQVLAKQLQATNDRFRVGGEITRTDVAQAEAALAGATAQRQTPRKATLQIARGTYQQVVGFLPRQAISESSRSRSRCRRRMSRRCDRIGGEQQPAGDRRDVQRRRQQGRGGRRIRAIAAAGQLSWARCSNRTIRPSAARSRTGYKALLQLSVPVYQGGQEYSAVRQAKQSEQQTAKLVDDARRTAVQNAVQSWETPAGRRQGLGRLHARSDPGQFNRARRCRARGHRRQPHHARRAKCAAGAAAIAGHVEAGAEPGAGGNRVIPEVAVAIGRLTARDLNLPVPLYDETAYYNAVKNKWGGLGDYATGQPGR